MEKSSASSLMPTYARLPVAFTRGEGVWLIDEQQRRYFDAVAGIAVCNLGHAHPQVAAAIADQAATLVHTSNLFEVPLQSQLADKLCELSGMERVFFGNSGAEANEAAIKLARLYGHSRGVDSPKIIVAEQSFHGRTLATLSATGNRKVHVGFEPLVGGFLRVPYNDVEAVASVIESNPDVVAVLVEPLQGEGGVNVPAPDYLSRLRDLCDRYQLLLMLDEVQTGMGRCGSWLAVQQSGVRADVITLAKALANGVPIGACLVSGAATELMQPGHHGSTFGGNPLSSRAALATITVMEEIDAPARAAALGKQLRERLTTLLEECPGVVEVRGLGLLCGIELTLPCGELVTRALEQGLLINVAGGNVVRLLPPLIIDAEQVEQLAQQVAALIVEFTAARSLEEGNQGG